MSTADLIRLERPAMGAAPLPEMPDLLNQPPRKPDEGAAGYLMRLGEENWLEPRHVLDYVDPGGLGLADRDGQALSESACQARLRAPCRWCPPCLLRRECWLDAWEIPLADACSTCGHWLVDECSHCQEPLRWSRSRVCWCECGRHLGAESARPAPTAVHLLARSLANLARGEGSVPLAALAGMTYSQAAEFSVFLSRLGGQGLDVRVADAARTLPRLRDSWPVTTLAAEVLADWPAGFHRLLDSRRRAAGEDERGSLQRTFAPVYSTLYRLPRMAHLNVAREAFEAYIVERWPGLLTRRHRRLAGRVVGDATWMTLAQAATTLACSTRAVHSLIQSGIVQAQCSTTARGRRFTLLRRDSVERCKRMRVPTLTLAAVAQRLKLTERRLARVLPYVCPDAVSPEGTQAPWEIPALWVEGWEKRVAALPVLGLNESGHFITLGHGLRFRIGDDRNFARLLLSIEGGHVDVAGRWPGEVGLASIAFRPKMLAGWLQDMQTEREGWLPLPQVADELRVKQEVVYALARRGLLRTTAFKTGRRIERRTSLAWLTAFREEYIFARDVSRALKTSARALAALLGERGVAPVAGPGVDSCRQLLFERGSVERELRALGLHCDAAAVPHQSSEISSTGPANREVGHDQE